MGGRLPSESVVALRPERVVAFDRNTHTASPSMQRAQRRLAEALTASSRDEDSGSAHWPQVDVALANFERPIRASRSHSRSVLTDWTSPSEAKAVNQRVRVRFGSQETPLSDAHRSA